MKNNYTVVDNINEATHWIPTRRNKYKESNITVGRFYELHISNLLFKGEKCIYDDCNNDSTVFMWEEGKFVKMRDL